jgi:glycine hydroxymethyltransferase
MVLCREQYAKAVDKAVFPGIQGGPLMHVIAAKAVALHEAMQPEFKAYQQQVRKNATALGEALLERGFRLVSGGTDNHLLLVDLRPKNITGKDAEHLLDAAGITCNKNAIPFDPLPPNTTSGIRLGSAAMTTRGFKEAEMVRTAEAIDMALSGRVEEAGQLVRELTDAFPLY